MKKHTIKASFWEHPLVYYTLCIAFCVYDYGVYFNLLQRSSTLSDSSIRLYSLLGVGLIDVGVALALDSMSPRKRKQKFIATISLFSFAAIFGIILVSLAYTSTAVDSAGVQLVNQFVNQTAAVVDVSADKAVMLLSAFSTIASTVIIGALTIYRKGFKLARSLEDAQLRSEAIKRELEGASFFADPANVFGNLLQQAKSQVLLDATTVNNVTEEAKNRIRMDFGKASAIGNVTEVIQTAYPVSDDIEPLNLSKYEAENLLDEHRKRAERAIAAKQQPQQIAAKDDAPHTDEPIPVPMPETVPVPETVLAPVLEPVPEWDNSDETAAYLDYEEDDEVPA